MTTSLQSDYLQYLLSSWDIKPTESLSWLDRLRAEANDQAGTQQLPTKKDEEWRFTDISPLARLPFQAATPKFDLQAKDIEHLKLKEADNRLVFVDGHFAPHLSIISGSLSHIVGNLPALTSRDTLLQSHLGKHVSIDHNVFAALNTAFLRDAAVIVFPKEFVLEQPVHLLFIATQSEVTSYPRSLIIGEPGSQATVIEDYVSLQPSAAYITNSVTEISLAEHARIQHVRVQRESNQAFHLANCAASLGHASHFQSTTVTLGAQISRYNMHIHIANEAAECDISGLSMISGRQLADTHTCIDHAKPHGISQQQHKCIVDDAAHAVFNGKIIVRPHAQRTNSSQSSRNLLLSKSAQVDTKPQLEIFADDVKCAHGATVGQLDAEEIFYLQSRGLSETEARNLLTFAFGAEIINRIPVPSLKQQLEQAVLKQTQSH